LKKKKFILTSAIYKEAHGFGRALFMGRAKNATVYGLTVMTANIHKRAKFYKAP